MADVTLPSLGESVTEGIITQWFKKVGDVVARDEPLFEVSTDKVDSEMPSPAAGVLVQILADEGDTVETGARVAVIDESGTATVASSSPVEATSAAPAASPSTPVVSSAPVASSVAGVVVSPVVRRILSDGGVEPSTVRGTGTGGAITRRDAERAVALGPTEEVVVELSAGRRRMGQHMSVSTLSAPHGFVALELSVDVLDGLDERGRTSRDGHPVSDEVVLTAAAVRALGDFEFLNATYADDSLTVHRSVNVGFTRHLADDGMLVPVVHAAARLPISALARRVLELDERLASRQLGADDLMGGTFTVSAAASDATLVSVPIIIHPQVAVVSLGAVRRVPVVVGDGADAHLGIGRRVVVGISFDHRVCDPTAATRYLERVGEIVASLAWDTEL